MFLSISGHSSSLRSVWDISFETFCTSSFAVFTSFMFSCSIHSFTTLGTMSRIAVTILLSMSICVVWGFPATGHCLLSCERIPWIIFCALLRQWSHAQNTSRRPIALMSFFLVMLMQCIQNHFVQRLHSRNWVPCFLRFFQSFLHTQHAYWNSPFVRTSAVTWFSSDCFRSDLLPPPSWSPLSTMVASEAAISPVFFRSPLTLRITCDAISEAGH